MSKEWHTNPKRYEAVFPEKFSLMVQEACWVKSVGILPQRGVSVDWPQVGQNNGSFGYSVASKLWK